MPRLPCDKVLVYKNGRRSPDTVKRCYKEWRKQQNPPMLYRCDEPNCRYYKEPLLWNGKELKLELDHINGVSGDNRPENLRFLCPNCHSQQPTRGGGNRGKVEQDEGGFAKIRKDGKKDYTLPAETEKYELKGGQVNLKKKSNSA